MKNLVFPVIVILLSSASAFAETRIPSIDAHILPNAKVISVSCIDPYNLDHDQRYAGSVKIKTEQGQIVEMDMIISRMAPDEERDASELCHRMKKLQKSGKPANLIFSDYTNLNYDEQRPMIMGDGQLNGLDPVYNG